MMYSEILADQHSSGKGTEKNSIIFPLFLFGSAEDAPGFMHASYSPLLLSHTPSPK